MGFPTKIGLRSPTLQVSQVQYQNSSKNVSQNVSQPARNLNNRLYRTSFAHLSNRSRNIHPGRLQGVLRTNQQSNIAPQKNLKHYKTCNFQKQFFGRLNPLNRRSIVGKCALRSACVRPKTALSLFPKTSDAKLPASTFNSRLLSPGSRYSLNSIRCQSSVTEGVTEGEDRIPDFLSEKLEPNPRVTRGQLANGLKYVISHNKLPPNRFEAHLEMHVGSVDEMEHEQGVAHLVEHVTFLGSKKREQLLGTGTRSNAYTDFHHTVFHIHAPLYSSDNKPLLPQALSALDDIAFQAQFLPTRIEKERRAVLAEAQMMNTIEYRVDCQLLNQLHWENALGHRFPIGLEEQIKGWKGDTLREFHKRWYFPANATLYLVGDLDISVEEAEKLIEECLGGVPAGRHELSEEDKKRALENGEKAPLGELKTRHSVRPPVQHALGTKFDPEQVPSGSSVAPEAGVYAFQHPLLQQFSLSLFQKLPVHKVTEYSDLRRACMARIVLSVLQFRVNARYTQASPPPFLAIEFDYSDSGREGCAVSTLSIIAEPEDWRTALQVGLEEVRRLHKHGVTAGELTRYRTAMLRDSEQLAQQADTVPSIDILDFIMESDALGHTVMDQVKGHEALVAVADTITLTELDALAAELFSYVAEYGVQPLEKRANPDGGVCTALVACVPATIIQQTPQGQVEVPFVITEQEIEDALKEESGDMEASQDVEVPDNLISPSEIQSLVDKYNPQFVAQDQPVDDNGYDAESGVYLRKLWNGVVVNYRQTENEPQAAMLRMVASGGRALETQETGTAAVAVGVRTLSEAGTVGDWEREQVELFCLSHLIHCSLEPDEEFITMDFHFAVGEGGLQAVLELLHLVIQAPRWESASLERAKQMFLTHFRTQQKSLERATAAKLMEVAFGDDKRFLDPTPSEVAALSLETVQAAVEAQLFSRNLEVSIVGDIEPQALDQLILRYLGTLPPTPDEAMQVLAAESAASLVSSIPATDLLRSQRLHLMDSDERACAYLAGPAPNSWAPLAELPESQTTNYPPSTPVSEAVLARKLNDPAVRRSNPLFPRVSHSLATEIINSRLFTTVRDALGLTYDVSFELSNFERLGGGWFVLSVTSTPTKIDEALAASLRTLRGLQTKKVTQRELDRARRTLLTRHESDLKDNGYWLGLLTHVQASCVPEKKLQCINDLPAMYEAATIDDVYQAYNSLSLEDGDLFSCIGVAGSSVPSAPPPPPQAAVFQQAVRSGQSGAEIAGRKMNSKLAEHAGEESAQTEPTVSQNAMAAAAAVVAAFRAAGMSDKNTPKPPPSE